MEATMISLRTLIAGVAIFLCTVQAFAVQESRPAPYGPGLCNNQTVQVRKEWGSLSKTDRRSWIAAVHCVKSKPSRFPSGVAPGAKTLYDDFVATHLNYTLSIHGSGLFLTWHRYLNYLFEQEVRACGYDSAWPYANWPLYAGNLIQSPIFDGSDTSLSGNGVYRASFEGPVLLNLTWPKDQGLGGGCVVTGPFANWTCPFRHPPNGSTQAWIENGSVPAYMLESHPHCMQRDLNDYISAAYTNQSAVDYLIYKSPNIKDFQGALDGDLGGNNYPNSGNIYLGFHPAGHQMAGPEMIDFFGSPSDPAFWVHHAMVDLLYTEWQAQDPIPRGKALYGTMTILNTPPSQNVTLDTYQDMGYLTPPIQVKDLMSVTDGPFCYHYDY